MKFKIRNHKNIYKNAPNCLFHPSQKRRKTLQREAVEKPSSNLLTNELAEEILVVVEVQGPLSTIRWS